MQLSTAYKFEGLDFMWQHWQRCTYDNEMRLVNFLIQLRHHTDYIPV